MSGFLFLSVLVAAMMHATWNTLMKSAPDKNLETALANFSTSLVAIPFSSFTRTQTLQYIQARGIHALIGRACVMGSYSIVLWAMTQAPIATVAAVRETSVLFAFIFAVVFLKELLYPLRIVGMLGVCCGVLLIRFA